MSQLRLEGMAEPFFISYSVIERHDYNVSASLGGVVSRSEFHRRVGLPRVLVGNYHRNNAKVGVARQVTPTTTSLHDNATGIPITIWRSLDDMYKHSTESYKAYLAVLQQQTRTPEEEALPDFEQKRPVEMILQPIAVNINKTYWDDYVRKASEVAKQFPDILNSNVTLSARNFMTYTYNTEGSRLAIPVTYYQLRFSASVRTDDGQDLSHTIWVENATVEQMPDIAGFSNQCKFMIENLLKLRDAPIISEAYNGPVLFEGEAVGEIFRRVFFANNRLIASPRTVQPAGGNPQQQAQSGNDFELMQGRRVMSRNITIKSITGQEFYNGQRLNGYYPIDSEGVVPDKELMLIENGVLRNMLNGRTPTLKFPNSNGHGRFDFSNNSWRVLPGNILITGNETLSNQELRQKLIETAIDEDLDYAYVIKRYFFGINLMYRLYVADGREELVRGAVISDDANLRPFNRILGVSGNQLMMSFGEAQATMIYPDAILIEEMQITRTPNIQFNRPFIVPKPNLN